MRRVCNIKACDLDTIALGLCWKHYARSRRYGNPHFSKYEKSDIVITKLAEYSVWAQMIKRCHNSKDITYKHYGGRGIAVCNKWRSSFLAFYKDMGPRPKEKYPSGRAMYSLERIDNDGNYEPQNVRWATMKEQALNKRKS